ncbi:uncharacterized protein LOC132103769 [Carassius carassius]|uniref:uncharacterized protein LOC132103769 n=1 Tax=Carassius carassius TaxID=217509 RepID=UPI0028690C18|nr:uncharacterized protein LOC132103769 [Carassius carassius]
MDSPGAQFDLSGQAEPVSTVEQLPMGDLSIYGEVSAMSHQLDVERSVSYLSSSVAPPGYHSPSECDSFSSGAASPTFQAHMPNQATRQSFAVSDPYRPPLQTVGSPSDWDQRADQLLYARSWVLQGPDGLLPHQIPSSQCLFTSLTPLRDPVYQHVERLWQLDVLPSRSEKVITRSKQDQMAADMLETKTRRVEVDGVRRYATPLLRAPNAPLLKGTVESVLSSLRNTEKHLSRDPERAKVYEAEIQKLLDSGYVVRVPSEGQQVDEESWLIPHHLVQHNGKYRLVFNCSFAYQGKLRRKDPPDIYEWQVLPFGTTCSPCCATFALQMHVRCQQFGNEEVLQSIEQSFYVDNCLQSLPTAEEAKRLIDKMRPLLASGGFEIRQWATNIPSVVQHLPSKASSESIELWLRQNHSDPLEPALGLMGHCLEDSLGYRHRTLAEDHPTMRYIYKVLATQYDPLGFSIPFTTRAKVLVQRLWTKPRDWDDPNLPADLLEKWNVWEKELPDLCKLKLPRCYLPADFDVEKSKLSLHVFGDASEVAYGSVAYLRAEQYGKIHTTFVMARSKVAPKHQLSMPRLELCAALTSAQLAQFLKQELTIAIETVTLWTDSTTVLTWIQSESCRYKVFVGTRVAEIQELTELHSWRYVDSSNNPADDITRGRMLKELANSDMWSRGPRFLREPPDHWPVKPLVEVREDTSETRKAVFCGLVTNDRNPDMLDASQYTSWSALVDATYRSLHGAAAQDTSKASLEYRRAWEREIRSVKSALRVVIGSQSVPEDVLQTVLIEVEGILNSKPLGYVSSDVADLDPITPNMLLMGRRDASLPQVVYTPEPLSKRRWRHSQTIIDHFWSYFTRHYLPGLQTRQKWQRVTQDLAENMVVMIIDPQLPRAQWPIGRVVKLIPSADGHVRSAQVQVNDGIYLQPVAKLVRLPALPDGGEADSND